MLKGNCRSSRMRRRRDRGRHFAKLQSQFRRVVVLKCKRPPERLSSLPHCDSNYRDYYCCGSFKSFRLLNATKIQCWCSTCCRGGPVLPRLVSSTGYGAVVYSSSLFFSFSEQTPWQMPQLQASHEMTRLPAEVMINSHGSRPRRQQSD